MAGRPVDADLEASAEPRAPRPAAPSAPPRDRARRPARCQAVCRAAGTLNSGSPADLQVLRDLVVIGPSPTLKRRQQRRHRLARQEGHVEAARRQQRCPAAKLNRCRRALFGDQHQAGPPRAGPPSNRPSGTKVGSPTFCYVLSRNRAAQSPRSVDRASRARDAPPGSSRIEL